MSYEFWGQTPNITTISATPAPGTTTFTVADATNLLQNQWILVAVGSNFERVQITNKIGNTLTISPALSTLPTVTGEVRSGRQLIKNSMLNNGYVGNATIAELEVADMSTAPQGLKAFVPNLGIYRWIPGNISFADGSYIVNGINGQWILEATTPNAVAYAIEAALGPIQMQIEQQARRIEELEAMRSTIPERWAAEVDVEFGTIPSDAALDFVVPLPVPDLLPPLRDNDSISVTFRTASPPIGLIFGGCWIQGGANDALEIRIYNETSVSITPGLMPLIIAIERKRI
ncbi:MAG: hypothetical protein ACO1RX_08365 [Candidatus Sericytochromatia bacterium]